MNKIKPVISVFLSLIFASPLSNALDSDVNQNIHIKAEKSQYDNQRGFLTYEGNVEFNQGSIEITADSIELIIVNDSITFAEAKGSPARFIQTINIDGSQVEAFGETIKYWVSNGTLQINKNAELHQGSNQMSGGEIFYNLTTNLANIIGDPDQGDGRMEMIFKPATPDQ